MAAILNPYEAERRSRNELRRQRAMRESPEQKRQEAARARMELNRLNAEWEQRRKDNAFHSWEIAFSFVRLLEDVRDRYVPKTYVEAWSPAFCAAIETLPEARAEEKECWNNYAMPQREGGERY